MVAEAAEAVNERNNIEIMKKAEPDPSYRKEDKWTHRSMLDALKRYLASVGERRERERNQMMGRKYIVTCETMSNIHHCNVLTSRSISLNRLTEHQEIAGAMINLWEFEKVANSLQSNINN